jgi:hypothetical protein
MEVLDSVLTVSTVGVAVTMTSSATGETRIVMVSGMVWPTPRDRFSCTRVLKPSLDTRSVYGPGRNCRKTKRPFSSLSAVCSKLVSAFRMVTVAPGMTAPVSSCTTPWMTPVVIWVWAKAGAAVNADTSNAAKKKMVFVLNRIHPS